MKHYSYRICKQMHEFFRWSITDSSIVVRILKKLCCRIIDFYPVVNDTSCIPYVPTNQRCVPSLQSRGTCNSRNYSISLHSSDERAPAFTRQQQGCLILTNQLEVSFSERNKENRIFLLFSTCYCWSRQFSQPLLLKLLRLVSVRRPWSPTSAVGGTCCLSTPRCTELIYHHVYSQMRFILSLTYKI